MTVRPTPRGYAVLLTALLVAGTLIGNAIAPEFCKTDKGVYVSC